jgi:hypothetical protein
MTYVKRLCVLIALVVVVILVWSLRIQGKKAEIVARASLCLGKLHRLRFDLATYFDEHVTATDMAQALRSLKAEDEEDPVICPLCGERYRINPDIRAWKNWRNDPRPIVVVCACMHQRSMYENLAYFAVRVDGKIELLAQKPEWSLTHSEHEN